MAAAAPNRPLVDRHAGMRRYFRRWNKVERWKWGLSALVFVVGLGWLAAGPIGTLLNRPGMDERYSHGPLADPHAAWESNCAVCHKAHSPGEIGLDVFNAGKRWYDLSCENCHAGPAHHASEKWPSGEAGSCASCHHDHKGRSFSLTRISDSHCTNCHKDLPSFHQAGASPFESTVTNFASKHPEFRALKDEAEGKAHSRTIKFSHAFHMKAGITTAADPTDDRAAVRLKDLSPSDRGRYRADENGLVQLNCASCHPFDTEPTPSKSAGAYFQPVNFEAHCKSCHPLGNVGEGKTAFEIPHRKQPAELKLLIEAAVSLDLTREKVAAEAAGLPFVRQQPDRQPPTNPTANKLNDMTTSRTTIIGANCRKCHDTNPETNTIAPVRIPTVWFEHAKFNHASHRGTDCLACHPNTVPGESSFAGGKVNEREKINLLGVESCRACHAPAGGTTTAPVGGVRHACTDCHSYHNGDHALQGRGATARDPARKKKDAIEFLLGGGDPPPQNRTP